MSAKERSPQNFAEFVAQLGPLSQHIAYLRALRGAKAITTNGDIPFQYSPGARNVVVDLRSLSPTGIVAPSDIPDPSGHAGEILLTTGGNAYWQAPGAAYTAWVSAVGNAGGTFTSKSKSIAARCAVHIANATYGPKLKYFLPVLGGNLAACRMPLIDPLGVGIATNTNFLEADFSETTGLQGNGSSKILDSLVKASQLGTGGNGGFGWIENNINFAGTASSVVGMAHNPGGGTRAYDLYLTASTYGFEWNQDIAGRPPLSGVAATNGHYYGQRSSATSRTLYKNGQLIATSVVSDPADDLAAANLRIMGADTTNVAGGLRYWAGRCAAVYFTDGTMTTTEIADFHAMLQTNLITPLGR